MTTHYQPIEESPYGTITEEDLIDDSTGINPMVGLSTPLSLESRFVRRLSKMLGVEVDIRETCDGNTIDIFITRGKHSPQPSAGLDDKLRQFVRALEVELASVGRHLTGPQLDFACGNLWDRILIYNYSKVDKGIQSLRKSFEEYRSTFDNLVTRLLGINDLDHKGTKLDRELGDQIISLAQAVKAYNGSIRDLNQLIESASEMIRKVESLQDRLKFLLEKTRFADKLYRLICTLGFPEQVYRTLIRYAKESQVLGRVSFHLRPVSPAKKVLFKTPVRDMMQPNPTKPSSPSQKEEKPTRNRRFGASANAPTVVPLPPRLPRPATTILTSLPASAQPDTPKDRNIALTLPWTSATQTVTELINTVSKGNILPVQTNAWYTFGFVTTTNEEAERRLAGLYAALLKESKDPKAIFHELQTALENNTIVTLFDTYGYSHFRELFPHLNTFLTTPPTERWTVWRLKQFLEDATDDEPPACLQRDYGFKYCRQREEVLRLKNMYACALQKMGPETLHLACIHGRLFETAVREGLHIDMKDRRFLNNDYGSPFLGLDGEAGLEAYRGPFYKKKLKL